VRQNTPFVGIVADDRAWGIVVDGQVSAYGPDGLMASTLGPVDYALVAQGFGALGLRATTPQGLTEAVKTGLDSGRPTLIQVPIAVGGPGVL
jgi:acetolactate synthase-1/2/3 large subunit